MRILIAGFINVEAGLKAVREWAAANDIWLFSIVCPKNSISERIAETLGAPTEFFERNDENYVLGYLPKKVDAAVIYYDGENGLIRRLIMNLKAEGKHGMVVKKSK